MRYSTNMHDSGYQNHLRLLRMHKTLEITIDGKPFEHPYVSVDTERECLTYDRNGTGYLTTLVGDIAAREITVTEQKKQRASA